MNPSLESLDRLLRGPVRWRREVPDQASKRRRTTLTEDLQTVARVTARTPEVMVRISGKAKGAKHVEEHLRYITREGDLSAEDENGRLVLGRRMVKETATAWMAGSEINRRKNSRDTVNIILSSRPALTGTSCWTLRASLAGRPLASDTPTCLFGTTIRTIRTATLRFARSASLGIA